jgi:hypothetical protein
VFVRRYPSLFVPSRSVFIFFRLRLYIFFSARRSNIYRNRRENARTVVSQFTSAVPVAFCSDFASREIRKRLDFFFFVRPKTELTDYRAKHRASPTVASPIGTDSFFFHDIRV